MLQLITTTGFRREAFNLCRQYMQRQDFKGEVHWIIAHDDDPSHYVGMRQKHFPWKIQTIDCSNIYRQGLNTQIRNLRLAMQRIDLAHPVLIIEDDDWYPPHWLDLCHRALSSGKTDLFGQRLMQKFNLKERIARIVSSDRSCLCATGTVGVGTQALVNTLKTPGLRLADVKLWNVKNLRKVLAPENHVVGIKGMPGRSGIDSTWFLDQSSFKNPANRPDPNFSYLKKWLGPDADVYIKIAETLG